MSRLAFLALALFVMLPTASADAPPQLPSWFPPPSGYKPNNIKYYDYYEYNMIIDHGPLPKNSGGYTPVRGRTWQFGLVPEQKKTDCKVLYASIKGELAKQGFSLVHEDWMLQKGEEPHATYVKFGGACYIVIVESAPNPFTVKLKEPAARPETIGPKDDIPYLMPVADSTFDFAQKSTGDVWRFKTPCNDKDEIRVTSKTLRRYLAPRRSSDLAIKDAYEAALKASGWDVCRSSGLTSHYTRHGRDIWSHITFAIDGFSTPTYQIEAMDTGDALRESLKKSCTAALYGVNFDFDKATLRPDSEPALNQILSLMKDEQKLALEIGGHTDDVGKPDYNLKLSDARAAAVKQWLIARGIAGSRLTSHGYGDTQPLVPNTNDDNRARNRRVEVRRTGCK